MRIKKNISLSRSFFIITITLTFSALIAIVITSALVANKIYIEKSSKIKSDFIKDQEKCIKYQVERTVTGVYRWFNNHNYDDSLAQREILGNISFIRFPNRGNEPGILFVRSYNGIVLASVSTPELIGKDVSDMTDPNGINTHELFMSIVSTSTGGFADYSWHNPYSGKIEKKRSYILGIPELEWYMGAGFWLDDINSVIDNEIREFKKIFNNNVGFFVFYFIILVLVILYITYRYKRRVKNNFINFNDFFRESTKKYTTIDVNKLSYSEFAELADSANLMISEREKIETELINAMEKAMESDKLKSAFLANISHEIRTPMNGILGFVNLLKDTNLNAEDTSKYINIIEESGKRLLNIINDLIDISKLEAGEISLSESDVNINKVLEDLHSFFQSEAEAKGVVLNYSTGLKSNSCIIRSDNGKIYAILTNLIKNAIKFTSEGKIRFGYKVAGKYLEFFVRDTGVGIPKNKQDLIFERFVQGDLSLSKPHEGSGLGLSIAKAYVEMLDGEIRLESEPGTGTTIYFTIAYKSASK
ncbi:MAG: cache domain-containing protein [Bacteroidales bacterium]|nr:cache domain-containing protein [Bacteroidales bacterium]